MSYEPDLIIGGHESILRYTSIAPVVIVPFSSTLDERILSLGKIFDMEERAEQLLAEYYNDLAISKQQLSEASVLEKSISVFQEIDNGGSLRTFVGNSFGRGIDFLYGQLGMNYSEKVQKELVENNPNGISADYSLEVLPEYAGEYILYIYTGERANENIVENAVWKSIPAVQNNKVIYVPYDLFYYTDILSVKEQQEFLTDALLKLAN